MKKGAGDLLLGGLAGLEDQDVNPERIDELLSRRACR